MRLTFDPFSGGDEHAFNEVSEKLRERLGAWLRSLARDGEDGLAEEEIEELCGDASMALQYKFNYGDGRLAAWTPGDVHGFLLDWCPRKVMAPPDLAATIPGGLVVLFRFLHHEGWLEGGERRLHRLLDVVAEDLQSFLDAMAEPSTFGMGKSVLSTMGVDSLDDFDNGDLDDLMAAFNALPEDQRRAALEGADNAAGWPDVAERYGPPALPAVALPDLALAKRSATASTMVSQLRGLAEFCGDGRKLTKKGNLPLADAREAVDRLGTGDVVDPSIGDRVFKTKSAAELGGLQRVFRVGKKAGVIRVQHGKALSTKRGVVFGDEPLEDLQRVLKALVALGPIQSGRPDKDDYFLAAFDEMADEMAVGVLRMLYVRQAPVQIADLGEQLSDELLSTYRFDHSPHWTDERVAKQAVSLVEHLIGIFERAGIIQWRGAESDGDKYVPRLRGGSAELTPAGIVVLHRFLAEDGYEVPTIEP